jgi:ABC-type transporter Mla MlaB component
MKIRHQIVDNRAQVWIAGEVAGSRCDCLAHFWDRHLPDDVAELKVDLTHVDEMDAQGVAVFVELLRRHLRGGTRVAIQSPPQTLAHVLYKSALIDGPGKIELRDQRSEEPYAG